jgi:hypothetical protein
MTAPFTICAVVSADGCKVLKKVLIDGQHRKEVLNRLANSKEHEETANQTPCRVKTIMVRLEQDIQEVFMAINFVSPMPASFYEAKIGQLQALYFNWLNQTYPGIVTKEEKIPNRPRISKKNCCEQMASVQLFASYVVAGTLTLEDLIEATKELNEAKQAKEEKKCVGKGANTVEGHMYKTGFYLGYDRDTWAMRVVLRAIELANDRSENFEP